MCVWALYCIWCRNWRRRRKGSNPEAIYASPAIPNGNMITRNGASVGWRSDNLPSAINAAGYSAQFDYAPDGQRWRQVSSYASGNETTIYVAGLLEKLTTPACARIRGNVN